MSCAVSNRKILLFSKLKPLVVTKKTHRQLCAAELFRQRPNFSLDLAEIICKKLATRYLLTIALSINT
jgi:hypothetical protein